METVLAFTLWPMWPGGKASTVGATDLGLSQAVLVGGRPGVEPGCPGG